MASYSQELIFLAVLLLQVVRTQRCSPEQIHIAPATSETTTKSAVNVVWTTDDPCATNYLLYGRVGGQFKSLNPSLKKFDYPVTDKSLAPITKFYHNITMTELEPSQDHHYLILDRLDSKISEGEIFRSPKAEADTYPINFITLGDWGRCPAAGQTGKALFPEKSTNEMIWFLGDMSYDVQDQNGQAGDEWFEKFEFLFKGFPMLTMPGNHETFQDFIQYKERVQMPNQRETQGMYYSYRMGPVFFVSISTEYDFLEGYEGESAKQKEWLIETLAAARQDATIDWILVAGHRPLYCCSYENDCHKDTPHLLYLEDIFHEYGVDMYLCGHTHYYDRMWPIYKGQAQRFPSIHLYTAPKYTTYVQTGIAGQQEGYPHYYPPTGDSVFTSSHIGYGRIKIANSTHLYWEELESYTGNVVDYFWINKQDEDGEELKQQQSPLLTLPSGWEEFWAF
mmetsp:Transcript_16242/g.18265  ORF Transcript_16242/g.18265 Transcript_16242/m.18265 type:complete len:451 (-) Transcript_16242:1162-2514(-)